MTDADNLHHVREVWMLLRGWKAGFGEATGKEEPHILTMACSVIGSYVALLEKGATNDKQ